MYYFVSEEACAAFFSGAQARDSAKGHIDLESVASVRVSQRGDLPAHGIELVTPGRVWVLCPEGERGFSEWLGSLSLCVSARNEVLQAETGDAALAADVSEVEVGALQPGTVELLTSLALGKTEAGARGLKIEIDGDDDHSHQSCEQDEGGGEAPNWRARCRHGD